MRSGTFNWTRSAVLPLTVVALETSWVSAWLAMLGVATAGEHGRPVVGPFIAVGVMAAAWMLTRTLIWYETDLKLLRRIVVVVGILCWLIVVKVEHYPQFGPFDARWLLDLVGRIPEAMFTAPFAAIAVSGYLWWRGIELAHGELSFDAVQNRFRVGLGAAALCLLVMPLVARGSLLSVAQAEVGPWVFLFMICGLAALSLARLETVRREARATDPTVAAFHRHWVFTVFAAVLGLWVLTLLVAHVFDFDFGAVLATPLGILGEVADFVLRILLWPVGLIVEFMVFILRLLIHGQSDWQWEGPPQAARPKDRPEGALPVTVAPEVLRALEWIGVLILAGLVLYVLWRSVAGPRWRGRDEEGEESRDSVWSWSAFRASLMGQLRNLPGRLLRRRERRDFAPMEEGPPGIRSVREIYRALLRMGVELEVPRRNEHTPYEYQKQLEQMLPVPAELATITEAYVGARYSARAPADSDVAEARAAWERVKQAGTAILRERESAEEKSL
ncbi:MAG: DUF4129 domain-containing protein [Chloroflexi bacterium]|nr:DUF4129 domain-containing protein [Chloroflexota bacterium]